ncbi:MAG: NADH-quinone oxidoreductase subunit NuoN [Granulosicoccus sp.]|nr:NADH-quinone oxidoreductase subunit NuoN [Granulosicoccus sp.]
MDNLQIATPEIFLLSATCAVLIVGLFARAKSNTVYWLSQLTLVISLALSFSQIGDQAITGFRGAYTADALSATLKTWILIIAIGIFLYSRDYVGGRKIARSEYFVLGLFAVSGMMIMVSATHMLTVYLGLELLALSQYAMVALHRDNSQASEAAMKYFVLGALASGMLLYGISMIYGATGSLNLLTIADILSGDVEALSAERTIGARFGLTFVIVGVAFKLGAVPFHMWVPDVYEGAPTSVTMFIATAPKIAAFAMLIRLLVDGLETLNADWQQMLAIVSALSMVVGNLIAIAQTNVKRMLAYSTISHVGFLLMGVVGATEAGYSSAMFYAITYAFTTLAAFGVLLAISREGHEADDLNDLAGLGKRNVFLASVMMISMISLAGVPPTVGFYAKLSVLRSAVGADLTWLALLGVVMSVVGAFYYLRVIKLMFFDDPIDASEVQTSGDVTAGLAINGLAVMAFGLAPGLIMGACIAAFS